MKCLSLWLFTSSAWGLVAPISRFSKNGNEVSDARSDTISPDLVNVQAFDEALAKRNTALSHSDVESRPREETVKKRRVRPPLMMRREVSDQNEHQRKYETSMFATPQIFANFWLGILRGLLKPYGGIDESVTGNHPVKRYVDVSGESDDSLLHADCVQVYGEELQNFCNYYNGTDILTVTDPWYRSYDRMANDITSPMPRAEKEFETCLASHHQALSDNCDEILRLVDRFYRESQEPYTDDESPSERTRDEVTPGYLSKRDSRTRTRSLDFGDEGTGNEEKRDGFSRTRTRTRSLDSGDEGTGNEEKRDDLSRTRTRTRSLDIDDEDTGNGGKQNVDDTPRAEKKRDTEMLIDTTSDDNPATQPSPLQPLCESVWGQAYPDDYDPGAVVADVVEDAKREKRSLENAMDYSNGEYAESDLFDSINGPGVDDNMSEDLELMALLRQIREDAVAEVNVPSEKAEANVIVLSERAENQTVLHKRDDNSAVLDGTVFSSVQNKTLFSQSAEDVVDMPHDGHSRVSPEDLSCLSNCISEYQLVKECGHFPGFKIPQLRSWAVCASKRAITVEKCCVGKCGSECSIPFPYESE